MMLPQVALLRRTRLTVSLSSFTGLLSKHPHVTSMTGGATSPQAAVKSPKIGNPVSENPIHRKSVREFGHSPSPLRIAFPLHIGFSIMGNGTEWVSENSVHRKLGFRE